MTVTDIAKQRRTIRAFKQEPIAPDILHELVDVAANSPSAMNRQPLEYIIVDNPEMVDEIFEITGWAGYLPREIGRPTGETKPMAFIIVLVKKELAFKWTPHDIGAAVQTMTLVALERGIGSCWIGSIQAEKAAELLQVPKGYYVDCALALGYPAEQPIKDVFTDSVKYYKDENGTMHVPKKTAESIIHHNKF